MQLYNTFKQVEERAIMIGMMPENKDFISIVLCLWQISDPTHNFVMIYCAWDQLVVLGRIYVAKRRNLTLILPADVTLCV
jgi:UPF0176 protein